MLLHKGVKSLELRKAQMPCRERQCERHQLQAHRRQVGKLAAAQGRHHSRPRWLSIQRSLIYQRAQRSAHGHWAQRQRCADIANGKLAIRREIDIDQRAADSLIGCLLQRAGSGDFSDRFALALSPGPF